MANKINKVDVLDVNHQHVITIEYKDIKEAVEWIENKMPWYKKFKVYASGIKVIGKMNLDIATSLFSNLLFIQVPDDFTEEDNSLECMWDCFGRLKEEVK